MSFSQFAVYTILRPDELANIARSGRPARLREAKRWVAGQQIFEAAKESGETVPIVYADAANDCSRLIYWGLLKSLDVDESGTTYTVERVAPLNGHRTQELVLRSTGTTIAEGYIRPYAIVRTPAFLPHPAPDDAVTAFMFGYWGNGSATLQLVEAFDAAEKERGFEPPLWVDVRIRRSVRAAGFRDDAFARLLGDRYVWMRDLGNNAVGTGRGGVEIKNPAAADELLNHVVANPSRRVIFFCACEEPSECHRYEVGRLLHRAAKNRGVELTVVEWPGGEPRDRHPASSAQGARTGRHHDADPCLDEHRRSRGRPVGVADDRPRGRRRARRRHRPGALRRPRRAPEGALRA